MACIRIDGITLVVAESYDEVIAPPKGPLEGAGLRRFSAPDGRPMLVVVRDIKAVWPDSGEWKKEKN